MCGATSAVGLDDLERRMWAEIRDRLRVPGQLSGLMRGFLGAEEVAVAIATAPDGRVTPLAVLITPAMSDELTLQSTASGRETTGHVGGYEVEVLLGEGAGVGPVALMVTPWMREHLALYARTLWAGRSSRP